MRTGCCTVNGPRTLGILVDWALLSLPAAPGTDSPAGVVLNYFGPCTMHAKLSSSMLTLVQTTSYPFSPGVQIRVGLSTAATFALWIRIPAWSEDTEMSINGTPISAPAGRYTKVTREWLDGDEISIEFDFRIRCWSNYTDLVGITMKCDQVQRDSQTETEADRPRQRQGEPHAAATQQLPQPAWSASTDGKWPEYGKRFASPDDIIHVASGPAIGSGPTTMCGWIAHVPHMKGTAGAFNDVVRLAPCRQRTGLPSMLSCDARARGCV